MIRLENLQTVFDDFTLGGIDLEVATGEYFVLLGPTGAGKSVLLETIAGLNRSSRGQVYIDSRDVTHEPLHKRRIGMAFQRPCLFPHLKVYDNIAYALRVSSLKTRQIAQRVAEVAKELHVEKLLSQSPETLSGGEQQRVALARTLVSEPRCLLLDEPISAIDAAGRDVMRRLLKSVQREHRLTVLHVTHDFEDALALADRMGVMNQGYLVEVGTCDELFSRPKTHFVADFLRGGNLFHGRIKPDEEVSVFVTEHNEFILPPQERNGEAYLFLPPQEIVLSREPFDSSARNSVTGKIMHIQFLPGGTARIEVDAGDRFRVTVLKRTVAQMGLQEEEDVYLTFKSSAVHVIEHCENGQ